MAARLGKAILFLCWLAALLVFAFAFMVWSEQKSMPDQAFILFTAIIAGLLIFGHVVKYVLAGPGNTSWMTLLFLLLGLAWLNYSRSLFDASTYTMWGPAIILFGMSLLFDRKEDENASKKQPTPSVPTVRKSPSSSPW